MVSLRLVGLGRPGAGLKVVESLSPVPPGSVEKVMQPAAGNMPREGQIPQGIICERGAGVLESVSRPHHHMWWLEV